ncbi:MAG: glycerophosphodiester phosphodiesterase [Gammaproteobacteria bacterium]|nr:glycerophosphodiester phosphodiesterase [Gammaproteobacteria bacterium]
MSSINFQVPVIAHRGASRYAPENTLSAFFKAKQLGAQWVEFDVMLSACGEAVVIHDETLNRTTNGNGIVGDYPYSYLRTLDAGAWFNAKFSGEKIPTFKDVILCLQEHQLAANVEIKPLPGQEEQTAKKVLADIRDYWTVDMMPPLLSSFSVPSLRTVRQNSPDALIGLLIDEWFGGWEEVCDQLQCVSVHLNQRILDENVVRHIKAMNRFVLSYTVNDPHRAKELFGWGVDAVFSDDLVAVLAALGRSSF